ncbi:hypothetical protein [Gloeothece verrucosa]|uniref:Uncharacterized protein n=1 Tax=Gloeothece verrucosa (strain PCC 7822) TaxID=497965 RepID=E0UMX9_GLOV7|nr:hypothetical protein [Gloeothece verrucosa]ADN18309.1 hypothetical protein Cyan7822_6545 [Gloeothece verrucosa PCC 7822]
MTYTGRGSHPNSLANLKHEGRPLAQDEPKKNRTITVTDLGWNGARALALSLGLSSFSELVEKLGRKEILLVIPSVESATSLDES